METKEVKWLNKFEKIEELKRIKAKVYLITEKYSLYNKRSKFKFAFTNDEKEYVAWYINEVEAVLSVLMPEQSKFIVDFFINKTTIYLSKSKLYTLKRKSCENFLSKIDTKIFELFADYDEFKQ